MTVSLDQVITVGRLKIAVLSDCTMTANHRNGAVFISGQKRPVAVLIKQGAALIAFEPEGDPMTRERLEKLCPDAWRTAMEARWPP